MAAIAAPAMLIFADADSIRPAHVVDFFALLGLPAILTSFLDAP